MNAMKPYEAFGEPVNAAPSLAQEIAYANASCAWSALGHAYVQEVGGDELSRLARIARARQRKLDRAYDLGFGDYMRIQAVM